MRILRKFTAAVIAATITFSGITVANAQSFSSGSSGSSFLVDDSRYSAEGFLADYKQLYLAKGYTFIDAPELIAEYSSKALNERYVSYLPNGNGIFDDSFGHIFEGYSPKVQRIKHHGHNIQFDRESTVLSPAGEGERVAIDIISDDVYYYIVSIVFNERYQG
ncbi:hypothetical protein [Corynebacterium crudilactis]|uniref:Uncharacterized protein n=1 Tax=Corynebacterium crudilactis TaxID=1652495 RepID=A0A172QRZ7_9CORY|nr:hypothetical protein [Corynebacterium crudilactis]ANE03454.1 hypothetical protein ccrud_03955 [Corynebacterium crudilactis]